MRSSVAYHPNHDPDSYWRGVAAAFKFMFIAAAIVASVYALSVELDQLRKGYDGAFFHSVVVRTVGGHTPYDLNQLQSSVPAEQVSIRFLGVPVNCLISAHAQPEDFCAIYRSYDDHRLYEFPVNSAWEWTSDHWIQTAQGTEK